MQTLLANLSRCHFTGPQVLNKDLASLDGTFDKIVLDAPCSSMGVISRHPEIKWHRSPHQIVQLASDQAKLLEQAVTKLSSQGELIYIVCTTEPEETTEQIQQFLFLHPEFQIVDTRQRLPSHYQAYFTEQHEMLILPGNQDSLDGFYAVVLKRFLQSP